MPFQSRAQQRYFYSNKKELEKEGVDVDEWSHATDYSHLPEKKRKKHQKKKADFWASEVLKMASFDYKELIRKRSEARGECPECGKATHKCVCSKTASAQVEIDVDEDNWAADYIEMKTAAMFGLGGAARGIAGVDERLPAALDVAGLGALAAPSALSLVGAPVDEKTKDQAEVGGLGILAATQLPKLLSMPHPV